MHVKEGSVVVRGADAPRLQSEGWIYQTLRTAILKGLFRVGEHLVEARLAQELNVSRTPVREAIKRLASEGLVIVEANRGARVKGLDPQEIREISEVRASLECTAVQRAAGRITAEELAALRTVVHRIQVAAESGDWEAIGEGNRDFHHRLVEAANNRYLTQVWTTLMTQVQFVWESLPPDPNRGLLSNKEHLAIIGALARRDGAAAAKLMHQHIEAVSDLFARKVERGEIRHRGLSDLARRLT